VDVRLIPARIGAAGAPEGHQQRRTDMGRKLSRSGAYYHDIAVRVRQLRHDSTRALLNALRHSRATGTVPSAIWPTREAYEAAVWAEIKRSRAPMVSMYEVTN